MDSGNNFTHMYAGEAAYQELREFSVGKWFSTFFKVTQIFQKLSFVKSNDSSISLNAKHVVKTFYKNKKWIHSSYKVILSMQ